MSITAVAVGGPLNPPVGPVQGTMKTLVDVEPRTAISQANTPGDATATFVISQPGSYYLTGDVTVASGRSGIKITSFAGVTLDLNGFTIRGSTGSLYGVLVQGNDIRVRNGRMQGVKGGISPGAGQLTAEDLDITLTADPAYDGISSSQYLRVSRCSIAFAGQYAISAQTAALVTECSIVCANIPTSGGIVVEQGTIENCTISGARSLGVSMGSGTIRGVTVTGPCMFPGIALASAGTVDACTVDLSGSGGTAYTINNGTVSSSYAANAGTGFTLASGASAVGCTSASMSSTGFNLFQASARDCTSVQCMGDAFLAAEQAHLANCSAVSAITGFRLTGQATLVNCSARGMTEDGFVISGRSVVSGCAAEANRNGFVAGDAVTFTDCRADSNSQRGFVANDRAVFTNCAAANNATGGFVVRDGALFNRCVASDNTLDGFSARFGSRWEACVSRSNTGDGIETSSGGNILNCLLDTNGLGASIAANIRVLGDSARIDGNTLVGADIGLVVSAAGNTIVRNNARNNGTNYSIVGGNDTGPIGTAATSTSPWANLQN